MSESDFRCRFCQCLMGVPFLDLGKTPLANSYLKNNFREEEPSYPLRVYVCPHCFLVQLADYQDAETIFCDEYAYFSSYSQSWLQHAKDYVAMAVQRFDLNERSQVIEIASNDGYLLQYFLEKKVPVLGIEPAGNVAEVALEKGIPTRTQFFGFNLARELARDRLQADLLIGNNVLAHVPDLNDFVRGLKKALKPSGVITMEFPHLLCLMEKNQFDTIYHEHFCYFSLAVVERIFAWHGLTLFDVEELETHGGSLRIFACHTENSDLPVTENIQRVKDKEVRAGFENLETYKQFAEKVQSVKENLLNFFSKAGENRVRIAGYGAPAKANTLINYCKLSREHLPFTVDLNPHKQGHLMPGSRIPIYAPDKIREEQPDYLLIFPWNLQEEIQTQMSYIREWGGKFVVPIPEVKVW